MQHRAGSDSSENKGRIAHSQRPLCCAQMCCLGSSESHHKRRWHPPKVGMSRRRTCKKCQEVSILHNVRKFTHVIACSVAFKRGVRDGDCDRARTKQWITTLGIDGSALQGGCHVPPQEIETNTHFMHGKWKTGTSTFIHLQ